MTQGLQQARWQGRRGGGGGGGDQGSTHEDHGGALRHHEGQHHVAHLAMPQCIDPSVLSLPLLPTIPAEVVVGAVPVLFTVGIIVLAVVGDQIIQGKAVMSNDEVDALVRLSAHHKVIQQPCALKRV